MARDRQGDRHPGPLLSTPGRRWLLLIHQLPSKPDYVRVKLWRRLQRIGAVAIKNSVYALPQAEQSMEHFQWLVREIVAAGGEASVCEAAFVDGLSDGQIETLFRTARGAEYAGIADEAGELLRGLPSGRALDPDRRAEAESAVARLRRRLDEITAIDFFGSPLRDPAEDTLRRVEARMRAPSGRPGGASRAGRSKESARTWVTRKGVYIDRIGSGWLIRRFIDPKARFRFVEERGYKPRSGDVRFDMFEGEYSHEGDRCTFEVLVARHSLEDPALSALAEIVHDIDLRDGKFGRPETAGLERLIDGFSRTCPGDEERMAQGARAFDALYESLRGQRAVPT